MTHATNAPQRRPHRWRPDRLHTLGAGVVAVLAVLAGILVVNLLNGSSNTDGSTTQVAAPTRSARPGTDQAGGGRTTPAPPPHRAAAPAPGPRATKTASASPKPTPAPSASTATKPPAPPGPKATAPVVVLNNSRIAGLAEVAAKQVESAGFRVERVGNYQSIYNVPVTTVFYDDADADAARALKEAMPGIESIVPRSKTRIVSTDTLILVITRDFPAHPEK
ncbi:hypothetical protein ThrDRAFT_01248 [Frankia casuarinae]|uniref:LytR/CpsA/Psr regulator C-terminal domain-containing protein n=1 Tax=Frankia casuarinae (strain DSM 45818 / CECT 9043 / HFP020203 / CcI3) TaxID=106370 RepID=Q2J4Q3_FRACC|nr:MULTISPECIES: LytR C-terminal domain-containing protein [Frankia]ABD13739.1 hypothetical protein Francci3_4393 [Frankia casuarinae]EYT93062.1 hypothetical protein ThrDRAFT_01248 [Frankia casuarinae]OFB45564.1 hypothetical protein Manayef4_00915 [Frankia sp. CgIM4]ORT52675.1 hypothetical protein KBI5_09775 [Frankia sp. KB5]